MKAKTIRQTVADVTLHAEVTRWQQQESQHELDILHVCPERIGQLELWMLKAQRRLDAATMQDSVEQQLLTCQEMFLEIEEKVASLSAFSDQQDAAELLASKLEVLKGNLVSFQQLLHSRHEEENMLSNEETLEHLPKSVPPEGHHLKSKLKRSSSVQEIFSSSRNKLLRQRSLQQQKELEQELTEQRGLAQAIAKQGIRVRFYTPDLDDQSQPLPRLPPAEDDVEEDSAQKKWDRLHSQLLALEERWMPPLSEVTDSSMKGSDGTAGSMIGTKNLKELQTYISQLRELGHTSAELLNQAPPVEDIQQASDKTLFHVLHGASLSLSSIHDLLHSPAETTHEDNTQLRLLQMQSLSAELANLGSELVSKGSKVNMGSEWCQRCVECLCRILPVVEATLTRREKELQNIQLGTAEKQVQMSPQQQVEQVNFLLQDADQLKLPASVVQPATKDEPDTALRCVRSHCEDLRSRADLQQHFEWLVHSLQELISLGSDRLASQADMELHSRTRLQHQLSSHMKFFQFLGHRIHVLQFVIDKVPDSTLQRWEGVVTGLQDEAVRLQRHALERSVMMQQTLQMWLQWEEDSIWWDSQLRSIETSFPNMQEDDASEEQESEILSLYKTLRCVLEENEARFGLILEAGQHLQALGCDGVALSTWKLEECWKSLHKRLEQESTSFDKKRKLRSRFLHDSAVLTNWMSKATALADTLKQFSESSREQMTPQQRRNHFLQSVALTKELETKSEARLVLIGIVTQMVQLRKAEESSDPDLGSVSTKLRQLERDWSNLRSDVPIIQQALHKVWMERLTQQEVLLELQAWLGAAESQLEEHSGRITQNVCSIMDLSAVLKHCKACQTEASAHQATLDYLSQTLLAGAEMDQRKRFQYNRFAEEQGCLGHRWLNLKMKLQALINKVDQELKDRAELETRLQQIAGWITDHNIWIDSVQTPSSHAELLKNISMCQDLEENIRQRCAALQELRDQRSSCDFRSRTDKSIQACAALKQLTESVKHRLIQTEQLWSSMEKKQNAMMLKTLRTSQTLHYHSSPRLSLQAQKSLHKKLQLLLEETAASGAAWEELKQSIDSLRGNISPAAAAVLTERLDRQRDSWTEVLGALGQQLQQSWEILHVWEVYTRLAESFSKLLLTFQSEVAAELSATSQRDDTVDQLQSFLSRSKTLQSDLEKLLEASKDLVSHLKPSPASLVQSECRLLSRDVLQLSWQLSERLGHLQEELKELQEFENVLESLEESVEVWQQRLEDAAQTEQSGLLELSSLSADLDVLNELSCTVTLGDAAARSLQRLNHRWAETSTRAQEACSELQTEELRLQTFEQKCESWMSFLQRMEDSLAVDIPGSYFGLRQQLRAHKRFQAELSIGHQILHSVITESLYLLQREVDDRSDFILKLAQLREHWQGAVQRADQRCCLVEGLVKHWHLYTRSLRKLQRFLSGTQTLLPPAGPAHCSLQQLRLSLQDLKHTELLFQRYQSTFVHTLEVGRQLFCMGDEETQTQLQMDLGALQEEWENLHSLLGRRMDLTDAIIKNWEHCEAGLAHSMLQLKDMKTRLNQSMPECDTDLQTAEIFYKDNEDSLEDWAESLKELSTMKTDLSQYIIADDVLLLQEQVEQLHCQWEELCFKVSLRKQEIADRLNAWIIFNEKNKELCEWLTQMENKVAHNSNLNIEEMVEKLKKDCMEEINLFSENKSHLKQLGEQLITASNRTKETEINDKLKDVNDRWQHLFDHIEARVRKLKETLLTVQQLDKKMSNLRTWLSHIEAELAKPVVYNICHSDEIQRKLAEQQDLQRDIEQHTESVASVLTLCDVLLHDADACGSNSENDSIQQTSRSLDRRWRNICAMSMERRMRIEETWRLWCKFLDDYSRFEDWLKAAEFTAASPDSSNVLYTSAKEELKKFEAFQRQVHERLTQLELVNKQYRRLARENRTDAASKLKVLVRDGNQRWDCLQRRVAAVQRRLKHFTSQREDFEGSREGILVWLTEMDLQLTNVEHFSESAVDDKMRQLNGFQQEITLNSNKIDALIVFGENLIQKSAPLDAVLIEDELEELHSYCQEVFGRVARFHHRLVSRRPALEEERETPDQDVDVDNPPNLTNGASWTETRRKKEEEEEEAPPAGGGPAGRQTMCHLLVPPPERSGRETPVSVDSIPLEWDHTVDVGGSSSHEEDEDASFFSALPVKSVTDLPSWHQPGSPERKRVPREIIQDLSSSPTHSCSAPYLQQGYAQLMLECRGSINSVKRVKLILNDEEELEDAGLTNSTATKQSSTGVIERWELLQAETLTKDPDIKQNLEQWQKLNSDLCDVTSWLGRVQPELQRLERITPSTTIRDIEISVKKLKELQKTFNSYKCLMISVNLSSRHCLRGDSEEMRELQGALSAANHSWTQACSGLERCERRLHAALMQCQEFHETLHSLLLWLSEAEKKLCSAAVNPQSASQPALLQRRDALMALQDELRSKHWHISALQEISSQLLLEPSEDIGVEAKEKVYVIGNKLHLLLRQVAAALRSLQDRLETCSSSSDMDSIGLGTLSSPLLLHKDQSGSQGAAVRQPATGREDKRDSSPHRPFLYRILRAAFPLHLIFFLLLVLICLVPLTDEDYSCKLSNNFARSLYPMLRYTNGPPPT